MSSSTSEDDDDTLTCHLCGRNKVTLPNKKVCPSCEQKITEILHSEDDDKLFADPPPKEDCPICMQPMPFANGSSGWIKTYQPCCGKLLCTGCSMAENDEIEKGNIKAWCAFCRVPQPTSDKERHQRYEKRMELNDANAFYALGMHYFRGLRGVPQDMNKALELFTKSAELGSLEAHCHLGTMYYYGRNAEHDMDKALRLIKVAAIGGHEIARNALGKLEEVEWGKMNRSMKHHMIAARAGYDNSLKEIGEGYRAGHVTKQEYATTLRAHQRVRDEMRSKQRDIAAALDE